MYVFIYLVNHYINVFIIISELRIKFIVNEIDGTCEALGETEFLLK